MKVLIFIHGGESFQTDTEYQAFLRSIYVDWQSEPWTPEIKANWVQEIAKKWYEIGNQVFIPVFPNKIHARYQDWKIVFEGILEKLSPEDEITLVGGSLGGCFLLKYFAESKKNSYKINQVHLLAACISAGGFTAPESYHTLQSLTDRVHIWHAEDDRVVPITVGYELTKYLPDAQIHFFPPEKGYGHFHGLVAIPELEVAIFEK